MKYLIGICLCLLPGISFAAVPQSGAVKPRRPAPVPAIQPTAQALMKSEFGGDKEGNREDQSVEELKKTIEREIAKSAALPVATSIQEITAQTIPPRPVPELTRPYNLLVIDGALYVKFGDTIIPISGGGASGCFSTAPEKTSGAEAVKAAGAEQKAGDRGKSNPEKP